MVCEGHARPSYPEYEQMLASKSVVYDIMWLNKIAKHTDPHNRTPSITFRVTVVHSWGPYHLGQDELWLHSDRTGYVKATSCEVVDAL